ncbi:unknown [Clostridium sp. CAG:122]|nr:unknown [Clostridium sp. CAG:122]
MILWNIPQDFKNGLPTVADIKMNNYLCIII